MNPFESTIESPLRFLSSYLKHNGEIYLRKQFELSNEPDFCYEGTKGVIIVQKILPRNDLRGELLDTETNTREYELSWPEYVREEFQRQFEKSKRLIIDQSKHNGKDQDAKLYSRILIDCLEAQKHADSLPKLNFQAELNNYIQQILSCAKIHFEKYYPDTIELKRVNKYYEKGEKINITGFRLRSEFLNSYRNYFLERIYSHEFVSKDTSAISIMQFFYGRIPDNPINWIKDLHELKFFIDSLCTERYLQEMPKQQWKHLRMVFIHDGNELDLNWHRNHNKLKDGEKKVEIIRLIRTLYPNYTPGN